MRDYIVISILFLTIALSANGQKKNVDAAWRLVGKTESVSEARNLLKEAMQHPQTSLQARTFFVAAMVEWRSYEADVRKREINPKDGSVSDAAMTSKLLDGYRYLLRALPLDSIPDKKGRIKPKYSKEILTLMDSRAYDLYRAGAVSYNAGKYFPQAYEGFMAAGDLASDVRMVRSQRIMPDSIRANAYLYAGLSAYGSNQFQPALKALGKAENAGLRSDSLYLYTMAIWEQLARDSVHLRSIATDSLLNISTRAYKLYGIQVPDFLSRMTQIYIASGKTDSIMPILNAELDRSADVWLPRGLRGWVYESMGKIDAAITDYKLAAEHPDMSAKMLMRAAHALYREGHSRKGLLSGNLKQRRRKAAEIVDNYLTPAVKMAVRAQEKSSDPKDLELIKNIIDAVDYDISLLK